jgi:hypothetical protein
MRYTSAVLGSVAFALLICPSLASAQVKAVQNKGGISMQPVLELGQQGAGPKLQGGREAKSSDWPASFYSNSDGSRCTATLVGPRALLLAAHCVGNGQAAEIELLGQPYSGPCTHADGYDDGLGDSSADYALCRLTATVTTSGMLYETIDADPQRILNVTDLLLTGYGCTQKPMPGSNQPSGGNDGKYRVGEAPIVALPGARPNEPNTIITRDETAICPGDSGGGAYRIAGQRRWLVAVNSRIHYELYESYLSSMSTQAGRTFISKWLASNGDVQICGVNLVSDDCR